MLEVEKVGRTFLKGAYLKRCHKTIKGFSYDPTSTTLLKDIPYFGQLLAPMSRNDIDAIGDKFCPLSKDKFLSSDCTLWRKKFKKCLVFGLKSF